jgi:exonuclease VII large subunit
MELIPALDHADTPTPSPAASASSSSASSSVQENTSNTAAVLTTSMFPLLQEHRQQHNEQIHQSQQNHQNHQNHQTQNKFQRRRSEVGFSPFQGVGRRTCDP